MVTTQRKLPARPTAHKPEDGFAVERVQSGVRMEKRLIKILKALADLKDLSLGDLLEGIVLHAFDGKTPFGPKTLEQIAALKKLYAFDLDSSASHRMVERRPSRSKAGAR